jgi:hypothetical protein
MTIKFSPIAIFCFNRPDLLQQSIDSLKLCPEFTNSIVYAYSDGPRNSYDIDKVIEVRKILEKELPKSSVIIKRECNLGLAGNIIEGVGFLCEKFGRVIVLEDDLIFHHQFLGFMNSCLDAYQNDESIYQVAGHLITPKIERANNSAFLLANTSSWGWATWARAWNCFDPDAHGWDSLSKDRSLRNRFNLDNKYDYYTMLKNQMLFNINSWAIRWYWSVFKTKGMVVYPPFNLVDNSGMRGDGSHGRGWFRKFGVPTVENTNNSKIKIPKKLYFDRQIQSEVYALVWKQNGRYLGRLVDWLKKLFWKIRYTFTSF